MSETVVFFGSGPVAAKSLALLRQHTSIEAIVTKPTTLAEMRSVAGNAPVFAVQNGRELNGLIDSQGFKSRVGLLIDFGIIVSQRVIDSFPLGIINSHFSLLPEWRGADPITFSILSGQKITGVSLMLLVEKMDEGPVIALGEQPIGNTTTTPDLTDSLIALSNGLLRVELPRYVHKGKRTGADQSWLAEEFGRETSYSRKLTKEDGIIDWSKPAVAIEREIRAFAGWPKSRTVLANKDVIITAAHVINVSGKPGTVRVDNKELLVHCGTDALAIDTLKPAGKREMNAREFLAGYGHLLK